MASLVAQSLKTKNSSPYASNWLERLRKIKNIRSRYGQQQDDQRQTQQQQQQQQQSLQTQQPTLSDQPQTQKQQPDMEAQKETETTKDYSEEAVVT